MQKKLIGKVIGFHGVKGELKVFPLVNDVSLFDDFDDIFVDDASYEIESTRVHKGNVLVKFVGFEDRNSVEELNKLNVYIDEDLLPDLDHDHFYISDLQGLKVINAQDQPVGTVRGVLEEGQIKLAIHPNEELNCKHEILVPFVEKFVINIDVDSKLIKLDIPDDLLDLAR